MNLLDKIKSDLQGKPPKKNKEPICSSCAEGAYWLEVDPGEIFCPRISLLHDGKCSAYRRIE